MSKCVICDKEFKGKYSKTCSKKCRDRLSSESRRLCQLTYKDGTDPKFEPNKAYPFLYSDQYFFKGKIVYQKYSKRDKSKLPYYIQFSAGKHGCHIDLFEGMDIKGMAVKDVINCCESYDGIMGDNILKAIPEKYERYKATKDSVKWTVNKYDSTKHKEYINDFYAMQGYLYYYKSIWKKNPEFSDLFFALSVEIVVLELAETPKQKETQIREIKSILAKFDDIIQIYKPTHPDFVEQYRNNRIFHRPVTWKSLLTGTVSNKKDEGMAILSYEKSEYYRKITEGKFHFYNIPESNYLLKIKIGNKDMTLNLPIVRNGITEVGINMD